MPLTYLGPVPDAEWGPLLRDKLHRAEFMALPGVEVRPWSGMRDAIEIAGAMTAAARELFLSIETSVDSFDAGRKLWDYELVCDGTVVLSIGDFHDLRVDLRD